MNISVNQGEDDEEQNEETIGRKHWFCINADTMRPLYGVQKTFKDMADRIGLGDTKKVQRYSILAPLMSAATEVLTEEDPDEELAEAVVTILTKVGDKEDVRESELGEYVPEWSEYIEVEDDDEKEEEEE